MTVPVPTMTASTHARSSWTCLLAASPVIHLLVRSGAALRQSTVLATFHVTYGRCRYIASDHVALSALASSLNSDPSTWRPAVASACAPPAATGLGSACANTTRCTPALISACVHGP